MEKHTLGGVVVLAHVVELVWVLKVDVAHQSWEHHLEFEFIYLHGLVLARKSTCVSKNDNQEAQHRIYQRICSNDSVLPCLQPPLYRDLVM